MRRDSCQYVRDVSKTVLEKLLYERSPVGALNAAADAINVLLSGGVGMQHLTLSRALRSHYKTAESLPHVAVAKKIQERTGEAVPSGSRVHFVFIKPEGGRGKGDLQVEFAEDAKYAKEQELPIDFLHYVDKQLLSPIMTYLSGMCL